MTESFRCISLKEEARWDKDIASMHAWFIQIIYNDTSASMISTRYRIYAKYDSFDWFATASGLCCAWETSMKWKTYWLSLVLTVAPKETSESPGFAGHDLSEQEQNVVQVLRTWVTAHFLSVDPHESVFWFRTETRQPFFTIYQNNTDFARHTSIQRQIDL